MIRNCLSCSTSFQGRSDARTCSARCRKRLQRLLDKIKPAPVNEMGYIALESNPAVKGAADIISPVKPAEDHEREPEPPTADGRVHLNPHEEHVVIRSAEVSSSEPAEGEEQHLSVKTEASEPSKHTLDLTNDRPIQHQEAVIPVSFG